MLSKKHFKVIAGMINELTREMDLDQRRRVVDHYAGEVKVMSGNPNFNRQTFIDACLADGEATK
jgi:hypothetical protein